VRLRVSGCIACAVVAIVALAPSVAAQSASFPQLISLFREWRGFEEPPRVNGVPDYTAATTARRLQELAAWQDQLSVLDTAGWSVEEQVDWHLVRAEMNGMRYALAVLKPFGQQIVSFAHVIRALARSSLKIPAPSPS